MIPDPASHRGPTAKKRPPPHPPKITTDIDNNRRQGMAIYENAIISINDKDGLEYGDICIVSTTSTPDHAKNRIPSTSDSASSSTSTITQGSTLSNSTVKNSVADRTELVVAAASITTVASEGVIRLRQKRPTEVVKVIYDYDPQRGDELNLKRGSRIEVSVFYFLFFN